MHTLLKYKHVIMLTLSSYVTVDSLTKIEEEELPMQMPTPGPGSVTPEKSEQQAEAEIIEGELLNAVFRSYCFKVLSYGPTNT